MQKIVALAGGVGGAKLAEGLYRTLPPDSLTVIVNTGDDFDHLGLRICPDLDTVCYTLAGLANPETGWGRADETWNCIASISVLGGSSWFRLGDRDLATHLERTQRLRSGQPLSQVTHDFCQAWGITCNILPMTDQIVATCVQTAEEGELEFQDYFVRRQCQPRIEGFRFTGIESARPAPGVEQALREADCVVICPSNPWVSVSPILSIPGIGELMKQQTVVAVSPLIGGQALKGPAAKMYRELGFEPSALTVARHYGSLLTGMVIDERDRELGSSISESGIIPLVTQTVMLNEADRVNLGRTVYQFCERLLRREH